MVILGLFVVILSHVGVVLHLFWVVLCLLKYFWIVHGHFASLFSCLEHFSCCLFEYLCCYFASLWCCFCCFETLAFFVVIIALLVNVFYWLPNKIDCMGPSDKWLIDSLGCVQWVKKNKKSFSSVCVDVFLFNCRYSMCLMCLRLMSHMPSFETHTLYRSLFWFTYVVSDMSLSPGDAWRKLSEKIKHGGGLGKGSNMWLWSWAVADSRSESSA